MRPARDTVGPEDTEDTVAVPDLSRRRFARRRFTRRLVRARPVLLALLLVALVAGIGWVFLASSLLVAESVRVTGTEVVSVARVRDLAAVPLGEPLARIDPAVVAARVEDIAAVESVEVRRCWPDAVCIAVTERTSVAVVDKEGTLFGLDASGILFRQYDERPVELPLVRMRAATSTDALAEAADVVGALPADILRRVALLDVSTVDEIALELRSGASVIWGSADESVNKARVLAPLLRAQPDAATYNVSAPGSPTVTLR